MNLNLKVSRGFLEPFCQNSSALALHDVGARRCQRLGCKSVAVILRKLVEFIDPRGLNSRSGNLLGKI